LREYGILAKKFLKKFTKIWDFMPNTVFDDRPSNETKTFKFSQSLMAKKFLPIQARKQ